jgi:hypothetical protein
LRNKSGPWRGHVHHLFELSPFCADRRLQRARALAAAASQGRAGDFISGDSLVISTTTYQDTGTGPGTVGNLAVGTPIPGGNAVSNGNLSTVWNNASVDGSFGVTSAITIQDLSLSGATLASETLPTNQIVTSFSSKSELGLNITNIPGGPVVTFMGYAPAGGGNPATAAGLLDVSNSDNSSYSDPTNQVTSFYGPATNSNYAFNRSVVALNADGSFSITQTLAYGGNNGRAAVLAPNGHYYTVGNSNNGTGTPSQLTTSTGLEVVTPGSTPNSTMIDPTFKALSGDKAGKSSNFRGLTYYDGNLYFSKGSGSNGIDTGLYGQQAERRAAHDGDRVGGDRLDPAGFPTGKAKSPGPDYTPFGLFCANPKTLYVADEGSGNATDVSQHAGLEKWTLSNGTWRLDYTLQAGLIGDMYIVPGWGPTSTTFYTETTVGLRNLTGEVNKNGTVTFWATTSTSSASGDNGADPNEIVTITDLVGATSLPGESFSVFDGPQLGLRYGGVAFAAPEASTWAMMLAGFAGLGVAGLRRTRTAARAVNPA